MASPTTIKPPTSEQKPQSLRAYWLRGASVGVLLQVVGLMLGFASSVLLARVLGPHGLGQYSYVLAIVAILSVLASLGLPAVVARLISAYQVSDEWGKMRGLLSWSNLWVSVAGCALGLGMGLWGIVRGGGDHTSLYLLAAPLVVMLALSSLRQRALQGLHHPLAAQLPEQFVKHTVFLAVAGSLWIVGSEFVKSASGVMAIWLFAVVGSLSAGIVLMRRSSPSALRVAERKLDTRYWQAIARPIFVAEVLGVILVNSGTIIIGLLLAPDDVGLYQIALRLSGLIAVLLGASTWSLAPWFSRLHATGEKERLQRVLTQTTRAVFMVTVVLYLILVLWGEALLGAFFGDEFIGAYPLLLMLGAGQIFNVASGPVVSMTAMTGGQEALAWTTGAAAVLNIALCLWFVPAFGVFGCAVAAMISTSAYGLALAIVVKNRTGVGATILG